MKSSAVFHISEGMIKFLQVSSGVVTAVEVLHTVKHQDAQISQMLLEFVSVRKINLAETEVTVLIPRSRIIMRHMVFPSQNHDEIRSMIDLQVANHIPYSKEEVEFDFYILSKTADGYSKVLVAIIPQEIAMRYWKIFADAKIFIEAMTFSSMGLWLLYQDMFGSGDGAGIIFDLDADHSEICFCHRSHWLSSREIPVGFSQLIKNGYADILNQWELTSLALRSENVAEETGPLYLISSVSAAHNLGIEISRAHPDLTVHEIFLTDTLKLAKGTNWPLAVINEGASVASLAGIALSARKPPIDLMPKSVKRSQQKNDRQRQWIVTGAWVAAAVISSCLAVGARFIKDEIVLTQLENQLHQVKHQAFQTEDQLEKINKIESMMHGRLIVSGLARELYALLPPQVYLVDLTITDGTHVALEGVASNPVDINQFQEHLSGSSYFSKVSLDYVNKRVTKDGELDYFKITSTVKADRGQS